MKPNKFIPKRHHKDFWFIKQHRFDTSNHPIIVSKDRCSYSLKTILSQQEELMLKGITNSLQCKAREAVRIALYELARSSCRVDITQVDHSRSSTHQRGHTSRSRTYIAQLSKEEKMSAISQSEIYKLTEQEVGRLAIIRLAKGIKDESITKLTNCKKIKQDKLADEWAKLNKDKPASSSSQALKETQDFWQEFNRRQKADDYKFKSFDEEREAKRFNEIIQQEQLREDELSLDQLAIYSLIARYDYTYEVAKDIHELQMLEADEISAMSFPEYMTYMKNLWLEQTRSNVISSKIKKNEEELEYKDERNPSRNS